MVGAGVFSVATTVRTVASVLPRGVHWIKSAVPLSSPSAMRSSLTAAVWSSTDSSSCARAIAGPFAIGAIGVLLTGPSITARLACARPQQAFAVTSGAVSILLLARAMDWIAG